MLYATYSALIAVFLPLQVEAIDPGRKVANLALVTSLSAAATVLVQPVIGLFSDRTVSRLGRRAPWMLAGTLAAVLCMAGLASVTTLAWICIFWILVQVFLNVANGPMSAIVVDRISAARRGTASGFVGAGFLLGTAGGAVLAGALASTPKYGYFIIGTLLLAVVAGFVRLNPDKTVPLLQQKKISRRISIRSWISPFQSPDFVWVFAARFLMILAFHSVTGYMLYILQEHIQVPSGQAPRLVGSLLAAQLGAALLTILAGGWLSDRLKKRKVLVAVASAIMAGAMTIPLAFPTVPGMFLFATVFGFGYGVYTSVDKALMTLVIPDSAGAAAKDLGILNIATNIPQMMAPGLAWFLISYMGGYSSLFVVGGALSLLAAMAILRVKSVD
ncbi:MFS family permease [Arthrobacter stackebrandtii]|uniref:MFS family permease n=1 Tax=Arthrobacter stackebrandtii TaxID=272161 RepID=A0ABS4YRS7_9MICC|nr:MFS family permease [Arthrobacter stackebrandtii]